MREVQVKLMHNTIQLGITPACAGSTEIKIEKSDVSKDHPRMCGKYYINIYNDMLK